MESGRVYVSAVVQNELVSGVLNPELANTLNSFDVMSIETIAIQQAENLNRMRCYSFTSILFLILMLLLILF